MLGLFVLPTWSNFYKNGMKTWEIRSYPIVYRGPILIIESKTNKIICQMNLVNCIPLSKDLWENNFEKHRTLSSFENLPYRKKNGIAYAWTLEDLKIFEETIYVERINRKPYCFYDDNIVKDKSYKSINIHQERLVCKFMDNNMFLYWIKKSVPILIGCFDFILNHFYLINNGNLKEDEITHILSQIIDKK